MGVAVGVEVAVGAALGLLMDISVKVSKVGCLEAGFVPGGAEGSGAEVETAADDGAEEVGAIGVLITGTGIGVGVGICLKKGRERLPQPGMFTSHPEEISNSNNSIAEKMDRLLRVSRNLLFLGAFSCRSQAWKCLKNGPE